MNFKRILFLMALCLPFSMFAQTAKVAKEPVEVSDIKFSMIKRNDVPGAGGNMVRCEVVLLSKTGDVDNPKAKWVRNVEVEIMVAYEDMKNGGAKKGKFQFMRSKAKLFAIEKMKKTSVVFYIPWESYSVYGISGDPYMYKVSLSAGGNDIPLTAENLKNRLSKNITSMAALNALEDKIGSSSSLNDGVFKPLNECAYNIQDYEYNSSKQPVPTYMQAK